MVEVGKDIIVILGPTASGKTNLACHLALDLNAEIISGDSRQIYRHMDIGTGKDLDEYKIGEESIPYHLIDIHDPGYRYNIAEFVMDFDRSFEDISSRNKASILCGGSGLYLDSAISGLSYFGVPASREYQETIEELGEEEINKRYDQLPDEIKNKLPGNTLRRKVRAIDVDRYLTENPDWTEKERPQLNPIIIGIDVNRNVRRDRITARLKDRLENGMIEEVEFLLKNCLTHDDLEWYGLEYKWVGQYLKGDIDRDRLFSGLEVAIHQFSKRQMTWFRKMENQGTKIHWIREELPMDEKLSQIKEIISKESGS